ncbi:MAG: N-acetylneuraminate synthase [Sphingobacteriales bacterium 17-39-43]|uniref:NeuD/PglB/VioB family sugar acetyltransferase n=1 Tax=Daejeonella sp. TaxID=2805397 RepID=UPI000BD81EF0|nr:NeuD/PglB/VioB family sugar acetyltransferase [Daejeonella sp.]OYZ30199.1 MAG: N-acetylneuraminate synthase [Sphingobacteriales bacterium 16-39-50]OZA22942.1 MAG: N-acetylneuraminate synthase [Sphingobacteriales bacterium 17-39-43]HQT24164.1 NeuD/PglB/VioB family sugar acetyltransferase [Daejeonella sp.]HQT58774.1 NeuD/PglB/VioB family sugar acetyltransferase [Daejeonella sp.]
MSLVVPDRKIAVIIGYSGHAFVLADAAIKLGINLKYYSETAVKNNNPFQLEYLGFDGNRNFSGYGKKYLFMIGIGDNVVRMNIAQRLLSIGEQLTSVIHPSANIASKVSVGNGVFISGNATINPLSIINDYAIINTGSIIEHECRIGTSVHIGPGAVLAGNVNVGNMSFIGANAVIKQGISIGVNVVVGAGAVVLNDIPDNTIVVGNPAKTIK